MSTTVRHGLALLVDVVASGETPDFTRARDRRLARLTKRHHDAGRIAAPWTVTAWDEFQTYLWQPGSLPGVLLELRQGFAPGALRVGVGAGTVTGWRSRRPINEAVGGTAFERAREALDALHESRDKYPRLTRFRTGDANNDRLLDLIYGLNDTLVQDVTDRQWETMGLALAGRNQEDTARKLGVEPSTVTRNLQRGHYWQLRETVEVAGQLLAGLDLTKTYN